MRKLILLLTVCWLNIPMLNAQTESNDYTTKATLINGNLRDYLEPKAIYPIESLKNGEVGTVVISFMLTKEGKPKLFEAIEFPSAHLVLETTRLLEATEGLWNPTIADGQAIDYVYLIPFKFDILQDEIQPNFKDRADKFLKKEKFDKVLKICDLALQNNPYDFSYYRMKGLAKQGLGNELGANQEFETYSKMERNMLETINIIAKSAARLEVRKGETLIKRSGN